MRERASASADLFEYAAARNGRDDGMQRAIDRAERHLPGWGHLAYDAIREIARRQSTVHIDDVIAAAVPAPPHPNAWGAVWMRAIRSGIIVRVKEARACTSDPKKHAHLYPVYRSLIFQESKDP